MNDTVQRFISLFITSSDDIPLSLKVEDINPMICGCEIQLASLVIHSNIPGTGSRLVRRVDVHIGFTTVFRRTAAFTFDFGAVNPLVVFYCCSYCAFHFLENPIDALLTIHYIEIDARLKGKSIVVIKHSFDNFVIPVCSFASVIFLT